MGLQKKEEKKEKRNKEKEAKKNENDVIEEKEKIKPEEKKNYFQQSYNIGEIVLAKWDDGEYYPAKIQDQTEIGYLVLYLDYGNKQNIPSKRIKKECVNKISKWICHICTFFNNTTVLICEICQTEKNIELQDTQIEWSCKICTFVNSIENSHCTMCNNA